MSIPLTINGAVFEYPVDFDENWGVDATGWAQAVTNGMLQMAGGSFPLTADVNFGPNFGLLSKYFETRSSTPATTGTVRLSSADAGIAWRNFANSGNNILTTDTSDNLQYNGSTISGGVNAGTQYKLGYYATTGSAISANPNTMAATQALVTDANGVPTTTGNGGTTATEIGYVSGVTSSIQTQINARVTSVSGTANQITSTGGTTPVLAIANPLTLPGAMTAGGNIAMASNKITGAAAATAATDVPIFSQLKAIQIVSGQSTTNFTTNAATFQVTNLSASITPTSSSNKILIMISAGIETGTGGAEIFYSIGRDGTDILGVNGMCRLFSTGQIETPISMIYIDSPASTSAITYSAMVKSNGSTNTVFGDGQQQIVLMEIIA